MATAAVSWSARVSDLRSTGMTLAAIGTEVGLSPSAISDIECGRTAEPKGEAALRLYELHKSKSSDFTKRKRA